MVVKTTQSPGLDASSPVGRTGGEGLGPAALDSVLWNDEAPSRVRLNVVRFARLMGRSCLAVPVVAPAQPSEEVAEVVGRAGVLDHEPRHAEVDELVGDSRVEGAVDGGRPLDRCRVPTNLGAPPGKDLDLAAQLVARRDSPMSFRPNGSLTIDDHSQGAMTMKLTASMMVTLDGVYQ